MGSRINTIMQPCFFHLSGVLPSAEAIERIKEFVNKTYIKRGQAVVDRNYAAIDASIARLGHVTLGAAGTGHALPPVVPDSAPDFVRNVTAVLMAGGGDQLPVSAFPIDGTYPLGTTKYEKRAIALEIPIWDPSICIDCGKCAMVCPHAAIRMKVFPAAAVEGAPAGFQSKEFKSRDLLDHRLTIQVAPDDCTGCGVCVDVCPAKSKTEIKHKSINLEPAAEHRDAERPNWEFFQSIAPLDRSLIAHDTVKGAQVLEPLFEFSLACNGCGETPYLKLISQLFGDRMIVGQRHRLLLDLRRQPPDHALDGQRPGPRSGLEQLPLRGQRRVRAGHAARRSTPRTTRPDGWSRSSRRPSATTSSATSSRPTRRPSRGSRRSATAVVRLREALGRLDGESGSDARHLLALAGDLVRKGVWIVGGDGWAYDIGYGGLDHVLSSGRNVNVLVLDTEVYSNTGGQASKATPRGAVAKFAAAGKSRGKKDLGAVARAYGDVYVAQISMGGNDAQAAKALLEADAWPGPSLVIAYSTCIAHGIDMAKSMSHQKNAVKSGYWPLYRFHPSDAESGQPFKLDSTTPSMPVSDFVAGETRFAILARTQPERAAELAQLAQADVDERWRYYEQLAAMHRSVPHVHTDPDARAGACRWARHHRHGRRGVTVDLRTRYLGLDLRSPIVASPSPLTGEPASARLLEQAGAAAIVLPSLFEEEIVFEELEINRSLEAGTDSFAEALDYFPAIQSFAGVGDRYLARLRQIKAQSGIPVIASLNATTQGGWVRYAKLMQDAGADALELNLYHVAADPAGPPPTSRPPTSR